MKPPFETIALIGKYQSPDVVSSVLALAAFLRQHARQVWIEQGTASLLGSNGEYPVVSYETIGSRADLAVVLGGDGTLLNAARRLADSRVPLVGVNEGRLGFLTDIAREKACEGMQALLAGAYVEEQRTMLDTEICRAGERVFHTLALNDVVVNKGDLGRMIEFSLSIDGEFVYTLRSDGMIVSTPTGSTAYALSSNGPILHPNVAGIALVPLCPHSLTARPITLPDTALIEMTLLPPHDARIHFDGQARFDARAGDQVRLRRSPHTVRLLHPEGYRYFAMLREKLHWSALPTHA